MGCALVEDDCMHTRMASAGDYSVCVGEVGTTKGNLKFVD